MSSLALFVPDFFAVNDFYQVILETSMALWRGQSIQGCIMSRIAVLSALLIAISVIPAEAKRFRSLPGTKPSQTTAPSPSAAAKPVATPAIAAPARTRPPIVIFGATGGSSATSAADAEMQRKALRDTAWSSGSKAEPTNNIKPVNIPNPDARQLPILGLGGGDTRPVKGFASLN
ncbi:MAG: hypothetical protein ACRCUE_06175 [Bosea sp. (in: a-proteobacteria)]